MGGKRTPPAGNLPDSVTSFVGRRRELDGIRRRMSEARLVTLIGAGGVGKTRLALRAAAEVSRAFPDGIWMVELASLNDSSRVAQTAVSALDIRDQSARDAEHKLTNFLADRQLLIVLDNCEHLIEACAELVAAILRTAPNVRVLATSREALGISGEHLYALAPLSVPDPDFPPPLSSLVQYESVGLLVDRARGVRDDFELTEENRDAVVQLCFALDGVPLAIELAATRLRSLGVDEVVERLDDRFQLLTGGGRDLAARQQTLRALIDWSYELCTPEEQRLWSRVSVFPGSFDLAAAEGVCAFGEVLPAAIVDLIDHLVTKSILVMEPDGERVRYRMLVSVREYGAELLDNAGDLRRRHRDYFLARALEMVQTWCGPGQARWLASMRADHPNLLAALEWSVETPGEQETAAAFAAALRFHWIVGGFISEGRRWLDQALAVAPGPSAVRGTALWVVAWIDLVQGDHDAGKKRLEECGRIAEALNDDVLAAHVAHWRALTNLFTGDLEAAVELYGRAVAGHERARNTNSQLVAMFQLVVSLVYSSDLERAREVCDSASALSELHGERWNRAYLLWTRGLTAWRSGQLDLARESACAALTEQRDFHDGIAVALTIELLGWIAAARGGYDESARLQGAARAAWTEIGTAMHAFGPDLEEDSLAAVDRARRGLGAARFDALSRKTESLTLDRAIDVALGKSPLDAGPEQDSSPLSRREQEVAGLIAEGLTNKAIAEALVLSPRTIDGHVERIFSKLGFTSRAQLAAWVADQVAVG